MAETARPEARRDLGHAGREEIQRFLRRRAGVQHPRPDLPRREVRSKENKRVFFLFLCLRGCRARWVCPMLSRWLAWQSYAGEAWNVFFFIPPRCSRYPAGYVHLCMEYSLSEPRLLCVSILDFPISFSRGAGESIGLIVPGRLGSRMHAHKYIVSG